MQSFWLRSTQKFSHFIPENQIKGRKLETKWHQWKEETEPIIDRYESCFSRSRQLSCSQANASANSLSSTVTAVDDSLQPPRQTTGFIEDICQANSSFISCNTMQATQSTTSKAARFWERRRPKAGQISNRYHTSFWSPSII